MGMAYLGGYYGSKPTIELKKAIMEYLNEDNKMEKLNVKNNRNNSRTNRN